MSRQAHISKSVSCPRVSLFICAICGFFPVEKTFLFSHNGNIMKNHRNSERFDDFARVICPSLCVVSGTVTDISSSGFKAEFNAPCTVDTEKEYEIQIRLSRISTDPLELLARPMWSKFNEEAGKTSIGFSILHSKDSSRLNSYIKILQDDKSSESSDGIVTIDTDSLFI